MRAPFELTAQKPNQGTLQWWHQHEPVKSHAKTSAGGFRAFVADEELSPEEKLLGAVVWRAALDLEDPNITDEEYSSAVDFFQPNDMYRAIATILDLSDEFLRLCRSKINGRKTVPIQGFLL